MKLQQATRCAIWAIIELASRPGEPISAEKLADTYGISQNHLAKVLRTLTRAKSVASVRGPGGGFIFCGNAKRLTLFDIISLFEDEWTGQSTNPQHQTNALAHELTRVLNEIDRITSATLRSITVQTIINNARRTAPPNAGKPPTHHDVSRPATHVRSATAGQEA